MVLKSRQKNSILNKLRFISSGDSALLCSISEDIEPDISQKIVSLHKLIIQSKTRGIIESVPSYTGLTIYFDPLSISIENLKDKVTKLYNKILSDNFKITSRLVRIPVCYKKEFALDIEIVALQSGLSTGEVIKLHTSPEYLVYMIGFTPGFPYLGGLDKKLETPRKTDPRLKIKAGSVGIAGLQSGIYPIESPGGWQIIGRTPLELFKPDAEEPFLFKAGDYVVFEAITLSDYFNIGEAVRKGTYIPEITLNYEGNKNN